MPKTQEDTKQYTVFLTEVDLAAIASCANIAIDLSISQGVTIPTAVRAMLIKLYDALGTPKVQVN